MKENSLLTLTPLKGVVTKLPHLTPLTLNGCSELTECKMLGPNDFLRAQTPGRPGHSHTLHSNVHTPPTLLLFAAFLSYILF